MLLFARPLDTHTHAHTHQSKLWLWDVVQLWYDRVRSPTYKLSWFASHTKCMSSWSSTWLRIGNFSLWTREAYQYSICGCIWSSLHSVSYVDSAELIHVYQNVCSSLNSAYRSSLMWSLSVLSRTHMLWSKVRPLSRVAGRTDTTLLLRDLRKYVCICMKLVNKVRTHMTGVLWNPSWLFLWVIFNHASNYRKEAGFSHLI
jgi:hypothetical protein